MTFSYSQTRIHFLYNTWQLRSAVMYFIGLAILNDVSQHTFQTAKGNGWTLTSMQIVCIILILTTASVKGNQQGYRKHGVDHLPLNCEILF